MNELKFALRQLLKNPGFTAVAVLTLALGIGANTALFSFVNAILLQPLPYKDADRLVAVTREFKYEGRGEWSDAAFDPDIRQWREHDQMFEQLAAFNQGAFSVQTGDATAVRVPGIRATSEFLSALGVSPFLGRNFSKDDELSTGADSVLISHRLWVSQFASAPNIIGRSLRVDGRDATVIGVLPAAFRFPDDKDLLVPLRLSNTRNLIINRVIGRLKPNVTVTQAEAELNGMTEDAERAVQVRLVSLKERWVGNVRKSLLTFFGAISFVLLIACANVANLSLARATARQHESAIRAALGASRARIVRQFLTESLLLALLGGAGGALIAFWSVRLLIGLVPPQALPRVHEIAINAPVLAFTFIVSILTGIVFGLLPAWRASRPALNQSLKEGTRQTFGAGRRNGIGNFIVASEIALATVLLVGAGLLVKSFVRLRSVDLGFNPDGVVTMNVALPPAIYDSEARIKNFYHEALERIRALPGAAAAGVANALPLIHDGVRIYGDFKIKIKESVGTPQMLVSKVAVSPGYFSAMGVALLRGRDFEGSDISTAPGVVIVSDALARRLWPDEDPLGKQMDFGFGRKGDWYSVVGVVASVRQDELGAEPPPGVFMCYEQVSATFLLQAMTFVVRTQGDVSAMTAATRQTIQSVDKHLPVFGAKAMERIVSEKVATPRFNTFLLVVFSALAVILAVVGIYGVMSYSVEQRTRELGLRMALGARKRDVIKLILTHGSITASTGLAIGLLAALGLTRLLSHHLYHVTPTDPWTLASVALLFGGAAALACYIPARRAARVDPMEALRYE